MAGGFDFNAVFMDHEMATNEDSHQNAGQADAALFGFRESIQSLDRRLVELLIDRIQLVGQLAASSGQPGRGSDDACVTAEVATAKQQFSSVIQDVLKASPELAAGATGAIDSELLEGLLRHAASVCARSVDPLRIACLGPKFSYTHLAGIKYFGDAANFATVGTIAAVFDAVARGDASTGIVPIENSTDGRVVDTLGMFVRQHMQVCGEVLLPIHHNLLSITPREEITEIHSKPQALSQCRGWLAQQMPSVKLVEISSTAAAAELAARQHGVAAVASIEAGRQYGLNVINASIEDNRDNVTRFAVLGRRLPEPTGDDKTSLLFQVQHKPGALADVMAIFKTHGLNLTWIESFPEPGKPNEYRFFVELRGHRDDVPVAAAIDSLRDESSKLEVLGSYPRATLNKVNV